MDETLCDTSKANKLALDEMICKANQLISPSFDAKLFADTYIAGIYRELDPSYTANLPQTETEEAFRHQLIQLILKNMGQNLNPQDSLAIAIKLQQSFDNARTLHFDFYPGIQAWLKRMRSRYQLVVITNGPEFSQVTKVERVNLKEHVDHIIIGGQEPAQKPAKSIFSKALKLCNCKADEVIHVGDSLITDIQGAINANIASVWVQHGQQAQANIQADWVINNPLELELLLDNISQ